MIIKFNLLGIERVINQQGPHSFTALIPGTDRILGYYSTLNGAVLSHIKNAGNLDEEGKEAVVELKSYVEMHRSMFDEVLGLSITDIEKFAEFQEKPERKSMSEETKAKIRSAKEAKKELQHNISVEEDDDDL